MKMTSLTRRSTITLCSLLPLAACTDANVRELGYTTEPGTRTDDLTGPTDEVPVCDAVFVSADELQRLAADDLASLAAEDRPFARYLSFTDRLAVGACPEELARDVFAASKQLNSLSRASRVVPVTAVGSESALARFDLRDYGFDRPVALRDEAFSDVWEAMLGVNPFGVELAGEAASFLSEETGTSVPVLDSGAFIGLVSEPDVYYALLDVPATLGALRESVGLPAALEPLGDGALRATTDQSRILRTNGSVRVIDSYPIATPAGGTYWEAAQVDTGLFLANPLELQADVQRLIAFTLPNGLPAFAVTNALGERVGAGELVLDTNRDDFTATVPHSCANCHAYGFIPVVDAIQNVVLSSPELFDETVVDHYTNAPSGDELALATDNASALVVSALEQAGGSATGGDPLSASMFAFSANIDLGVAANELLVTRDELGARIGELDRGLLPLGLGLSLSRQRFGELYAGAYCVLHADDTNAPVGCE